MNLLLIKYDNRLEIIKLKVEEIIILINSTPVKK
jgi:hypothetical protein